MVSSIRDIGVFIFAITFKLDILIYTAENRLIDKPHKLSQTSVANVYDNEFEVMQDFARLADVNGILLLPE